MRLTTRGRYAVAAMVELAQCYDANSDSDAENRKNLSVGDIAQRSGIPAKYLEKQFAVLRAEGLVLSERGANGGYRLADAPTQVSIGSILSVVDKLDSTSCSGNKNCNPDGSLCKLHNLWTSLNSRVHVYLDSIMLSDVLDANARHVNILGNEPLTVQGPV